MREVRKGMLLVISGPSGAGKGTLYGKLLRDDPTMTFSVSYATRSPRPGGLSGAADRPAKAEKAGRRRADAHLCAYA